jgi:hypothetical protein
MATKILKQKIVGQLGRDATSTIPVFSGVATESLMFFVHVCIVHPHISS